MKVAQAKGDTIGPPNETTKERERERENHVTCIGFGPKRNSFPTVCTCLGFPHTHARPQLDRCVTSPRRRVEERGKEEEGKKKGSFGEKWSKW